MLEEILLSGGIFIGCIIGTCILSIGLGIIITIILLVLASINVKYRRNIQTFVRSYNNIDQNAYKNKYFITKGKLAKTYSYLTRPLHFIGGPTIVFISGFSPEKGFDAFHKYKQIIHLNRKEN